MDEPLTVRKQKTWSSENMTAHAMSYVLRHWASTVSLPYVTQIWTVAFWLPICCILGIVNINQVAHILLIL